MFRNLINTNLEQCGLYWTGAYLHRGELQIIHEELDKVTAVSDFGKWERIRECLVAPIFEKPVISAKAIANTYRYWLAKQNEV